MSKMQKYLIGLAAVCVVFFGFVIVRIGIAQPNDDSVKLAKISHEDYAHLGKAAYKDAYPLEYNSYMKNNLGGASPTGYGGSDPGKSYIEMQPELLTNFKGYKFWPYLGRGGSAELPAHPAPEGQLHSLQELLDV